MFMAAYALIHGISAPLTVLALAEIGCLRVYTRKRHLPLHHLFTTNTRSQQKILPHPQLSIFIRIT